MDAPPGKASSGSPLTSPATKGRTGNTGEETVPRSHWLGVTPSFDFSSSAQMGQSTFHFGEGLEQPKTPAFQFGQDEADLSNDHATFTFRSIHNRTPRPSLSPSPVPSPEPSSTSSAITVKNTSPHSKPSILFPNAEAKNGSDLSKALNSLRIHSDRSASSSSVREPVVRAPRGADGAGESTAGVRIGFHQRRRGVEYDVNSERAPSHPFFTQALQQALISGAGTAKQAAAYIQDLNEIDDPGVVATKLLRDAKKLSAFHAEDTRTIAVLGDSGEGLMANPQRICGDI